MPGVPPRRTRKSTEVGLPGGDGGGGGSGAALCGTLLERGRLVLTWMLFLLLLLLLLLLSLLLLLLPLLSRVFLLTKALVRFLRDGEDSVERMMSCFSLSRGRRTSSFRVQNNKLSR